VPEDDPLCGVPEDGVLCAGWPCCADYELPAAPLCAVDETAFRCDPPLFDCAKLARISADTTMTTFAVTTLRRFKKFSCFYTFVIPRARGATARSHKAREPGPPLRAAASARCGEGARRKDLV